MDAAVAAWGQFVLCALAIAFAGTRLSRYGDAIADKSGWSGSWTGLVLLATVTSLPELAAGASSAALAQVPDIAVGDVLGSCVFNLAILALLDLLYRKETLYRRAAGSHLLAAGFGVVMLAMIGLGLLLGRSSDALALGHVGIFAPAGALLYLFAVRSVFAHESTTVRVPGGEPIDRYSSLSLGQAVRRYSAAALVVVAAGVWLPYLATRLAGLMDWQTSVVGTLFVAVATSLPELVVSLSSLRLGALDMAVANLLGSNLFNILILSIDDLLYLQGPLLSHGAPGHAITAFSALLMNGLVVVGFAARPAARPLKLASWIGIALLAVFIMNFVILFRHGD